MESGYYRLWAVSRDKTDRLERIEGQTAGKY